MEKEAKSRERHRLLRNYMVSFQTDLASIPAKKHRSYTSASSYKRIEPLVGQKRGIKQKRAHRLTLRPSFWGLYWKNQARWVSGDVCRQTDQSSTSMPVRCFRAALCARLGPTLEIFEETSFASLIETRVLYLYVE